MYNYAKKLVTVFGMMFLMLGGITFAASSLADAEKACPDWQTYDSNVWTCVLWTVEILWSCKDWEKRIDWVCESCDKEWVCCGIQLNTNVPFIWNCIELSNGNETNTDNNETRVTEQTAFPILMWSLTKMMVTIIMLVSFVAILAWWVMIASSGWSDSWASNGKKLIWRVVIALALLWASGVILRLINPNFFW